MAQTLDMVNKRLKAAGIRVSIVQRGQTYYLQATLPPKTDEVNPKQRQIPLGINATLDTAFGKAMELSSQLTLGTFRWALWDNKRQFSEKWKVGDAIAAYKKHYRSTHSCSDHTWDRFWQNPLDRLPQDAILSAAIAIATVCAIPESQWTRKNACEKIQSLYDWAGVPVDLKPYRGATKRKRKINPPSKDQIEEAYYLISEGWKVIYARISLFGLRPHEAFFFEPIDLFRGRIKDSITSFEGKVLKPKTGGRLVYAIHTDLAEEWRTDRIQPNLNCRTAQEYGKRTNRHFFEAGIKFAPYDLRHAYAIEASVVRGIPYTVTAKYMGHSPELHIKTYQAWMDQQTAARVYDEKILCDRPLNPESVV